MTKKERKYSHEYMDKIREAENVDICPEIVSQ